MLSSDAEILFAHALKKPREFVIAHPEYRPTVWQHLKLKYYLQQRKKGMPIAYITGHKEFFGLDFIVNKHVLIPRPETEVLVEAVLHRLSEQRPANPEKSGRAELGAGSEQKILLIDVGTGSGCIPIATMKTLKQENAAAEQYKKITVCATDISQDALIIAKKNAKKHDVDITFLHGDLLEPIFYK